MGKQSHSEDIFQQVIAFSTQRGDLEISEINSSVSRLLWPKVIIHFRQMSGPRQWTHRGPNHPLSMLLISELQQYVRHVLDYHQRKQIYPKELVSSPLSSYLQYHQSKSLLRDLKAGQLPVSLIGLDFTFKPRYTNEPHVVESRQIHRYRAENKWDQGFDQTRWYCVLEDTHSNEWLPAVACKSTV
jgi:hypothetical protein